MRTPVEVWQWVLLPVVLGAVAVVAFIPHSNPLTGDTRVYPVHMDEYVHWHAALKVLDEGTTASASQVDRSDKAEVVAEALHERGFHAYLAAFHDASGIPWPEIFRYGPAVVAVLAALAVFVLAQRWGAGIEAALFLALVPTTLRFLGPGFLVPIAWTMPVLAFGLHVISSLPTFRTYVVLAIVCAGLWPIHAMGALVMVLLVALVALATLRGIGATAALIGVAVTPALLAYPYYASALGDPRSAPMLPAEIDVFALAGLPLFLAAAVGVFLMVLGTSSRPAGLALAALLVGGLLIVLVRVEQNVDVLRMYDRSVTLLPFLAAVPAGIALATLRTRLSRATARWRLAPVAIAIVLLGQAFVVQAGARAQMEQPLYEVVNAERFEEYAALRAIEGAGGRSALVDGQTIPFTIASGIPTVHVFLPLDTGPPEAIEAFFAGGAADTRYLLASGATIVVTQRNVANPYLERVSPSVYVLDAEAIEALRDA